MSYQIQGYEEKGGLGILPETKTQEHSPELQSV
jgi:hypothetical protein